MSNRSLDFRLNYVRRFTPIIALLLLAVVLAACAGLPGAATDTAAATPAPAATTALADSTPTAEQPSAEQSPTTAADKASLTQSAEAGAVTVEITPLNLKDTTATTLDFKVAMNTHSVELGVDLAKMAALQTGDKEIPAQSWQGPTGGGHHVEGTLSFPASSDGQPVLGDTSEFSLVFRGLADIPERVFSWNMSQIQAMQPEMMAGGQMGAGQAMTGTMPMSGTMPMAGDMMGMMGNMDDMMAQMQGMMGAMKDMPPAEHQQMMQNMMGMMSSMMGEMKDMPPAEHQQMMQNMMGMMSGMMSEMKDMPPAEHQQMMQNMMGMMSGMMGMMGDMKDMPPAEHQQMMQGMMGMMSGMMGMMGDMEDMPAAEHQQMMDEMMKMMSQMQGMDMQGMDMQGMDMQGMDMQGMDMQGMDMQGMDMQGMDMSGDSMAGHMAPIPSADVPDATESVGGQPLAFEVVDGVKVFELTAKPVRWQILDGVTVTAWTYNGTVPGPMIRVTAGDRVRIVLKNDLPEPTSIHWHGIAVPNAMDGMTPIQPGESFSYEFTAPPAGSFMYHSHIGSDKQVMIGMYAPFIVDPKRPERNQPAVDVSWMLSEWRVGSDGETYPAMPMAGAEPNYFTINGKAYPATQAIEVKKGERVRVRLANIGQLVHPMHLHGMNFKVVAMDGVTLPPGQQMVRNTIPVNPGELIDIEFTADNVGEWMFHCHVLHHVTNDGAEPGGLLAVVKVTE